MNPWIKHLLITISILLGLVFFYIVYTHTELEHKELSFFSQERQRLVEVDMTIRRDKLNYINLPVAIICHGNTGHKTDYSFIANFLATKGYLVLSIQTQNPEDVPMPTIPGKLYVGRLDLLKLAEADISFVLQQIIAYFPSANINHLTLIGHSLGGDEVLFYAQLHPEKIKQVITLDNLRVPIPLLARFPILSFRSTDPQYKTDTGVLPDKDISDKYGVTIVPTPFKHTWMTDWGPQETKNNILEEVEKFIK